MIRIEKPIDELTTEIFEFAEFDMSAGYNLILDNYYILKKESKRHKPVIISKYCRLNVRDSNITENQVPLTDEIKTQVFNEYISKIKVIKWSEKNK